MPNLPSSRRGTRDKLHFVMLLTPPVRRPQFRDRLRMSGIDFSEAAMSAIWTRRRNRGAHPSRRSWSAFPGWSATMIGSSEAGPAGNPRRHEAAAARQPSCVREECVLRVNAGRLARLGSTLIAFSNKIAPNEPRSSSLRSTKATQADGDDVRFRQVEQSGWHARHDARARTARSQLAPWRAVG
jgi:hypothetical protein